MLFINKVAFCGKANLLTVELIGKYKRVVVLKVDALNEKGI